MKSTSTFVNATRQHDTLTDNGAVTHSTSLNNVVDMFFLAGASRNMSENDIISIWEKAKIEDTKLAIKCLFWARDIRGGAGERRFFHIIMKHILNTDSDLYKSLSVHIPEFGYWKDIFQIEGICSEHTISWLIKNLIEGKNGLLAKWFPRKGMWFSSAHRYLKMSPKEFRKILVSLSSTVEQQMCARQWEEIKYSGVPSLAFNLYKSAFQKHDETRFKMFIQDVLDGKSKISANAIFPYQLYQSWQKQGNNDAINAQWKNLPNFVEEGSFLPVCDVSGSMTGLPMDISISLGVYLSERNKSIFKDAFITFTKEPEMNYLKGSTTERFSQLAHAKWGTNTNLQAVFELILNTATSNNLEANDMPETLIIISDMEFDIACGKKTNFEAINDKYAEAGYPCPKLIFWNVNGRIGNSPVSVDDKNVALVSGASPSIVKSVLSGEEVTPLSVMLKALNVERYEKIC